MHALFLSQGSPHHIDVQRYFMGKPQASTPVSVLGRADSRYGVSR